MTLVKKLKAAQGDNAELCHVAAKALEQLSTDTCAYCKWGNISEKDGCAYEGCWDYEGNDDSIQPHTGAPKKRKIDWITAPYPNLIASNINGKCLQQSDIQAIVAKDGCYAVFYWKDVDEA